MKYRMEGKDENQWSMEGKERNNGVEDEGEGWETIEYRMEGKDENQWSKGWRGVNETI